ncbi:MAG: hypothetical protein ACI4F9_07845 [Lachnospiraceae bacterium]
MEHLTQQEVMRLVYKINGELKLTSEEEERLSHTLECEMCEKQIAQCLEILKFMQPSYVQNFVSNIGGKKQEFCEDDEEFDEFDEEMAEYKADFGEDSKM